MSIDTERLRKLFPNAPESFFQRNGHLDASPPPSKWTPQEREKLEAYYRDTDPAIFSLAELAALLGRTEAGVALKASECGFSMARGKRVKSDAQRESMSKVQSARATERPESFFPIAKHMEGKPHPNKGQPLAAAHRAKISDSVKASILKNGHPRGFKGKAHTQATKEAIGQAGIGRVVPREQVERTMRTKADRGTLAPPRQGCTWKAGWVQVGDKKFYARSRWEANYGRYLEWLKKHGQIDDWRHEPTTFWFPNIKRGCVSYLPDFEVTVGGVLQFHEVKGWMDARSKTKIRRMAKYHPKVTLIVIDSASYKSLARSISNLVPGWLK